MKLTVLIPARLASTRLPNKPLSDVAGLPLIVRVAQQVLSYTTNNIASKAINTPATAINDVKIRAVVACDSESILTVCQQQGIEAVLTRNDHPSGSDRLAEACEMLQLADDEIVVNVQGDEPLIAPSLIRAVAETLAEKQQAAIATAAQVIVAAEEFFNPNVVKVVCDANGFARYFSRAPIPYARDAFAQKKDALPAHFPALRHIGIYAYRAGFLKRYASLPPAPAEQLESLEQLRALHHGYRIAVTVWPGALAPGVDTPEDLEKVRARFTVS